MRARARWGKVALCLAGLGLPGCASFGPGGLSQEAAGGDVEVRPDAPPEYDVLVGQDHEINGRYADALAAYQRAVAKDDQSAYLHFKVAEALAQQRRLDESLEHARRAFELDPDDVEVRLLLGKLYSVRRDPSAAEPVLLNEAGEPVEERAALLLYQIYLEAGRAEDALALAQWMAAQDAYSLRARVALATAYERLGRPEDAEQMYRDAIELSPGDPETLRLYHALARSLRDRKEHAAEIEVYRQVLELFPRHHVTLIALAEAQMSRDDLTSAIATFEEIERAYPDDLRSVVRLGFLMFEARAWGGAAPRFERFLEVNPREFEVVYFLGSARRRAGDEEGANRAFEGIPSEHKNYADARAEMASMLERRGDYQGALTQVQLAAAASPSRALDLYIATLRAKAGDFDGAVAHLEGLLSEQPRDDELLYQLGVVYGEAKRLEESLRYMRLALEENPDNASALNYVGYTWAERGIRLDEAEELIVRALEIRPEDGYITDSLGWVYYMRARPLVESGQMEQARQYLERAIQELERAHELTGGDPVVSEHLGDIYLLQGNRQRALEKFEEAVQLEPRPGEQPDLLQKLEKLRHELE